MPMKNFVGRGAGFGLSAGCGFGVGWGFGGVPIGFAGMGIGGGCGVGLGLGWGFGAAFGAEYLDVQPKFAGNKRPSLLERIGRNTAPRTSIKRGGIRSSLSPFENSAGKEGEREQETRS